MKSADRQETDLEKENYEDKLKKYETMEDEPLALLAKNGDGFALESLLERYKASVRVKARSYFLVGANQEDIVQEGMIGLYKAIRDYSDDKQTSFRGFADVCVTRQMITAIKSATRQKHLPLNSYVSLNQSTYEAETDQTFEETLGDPVLSPEEIVIDRESYADMEKTIEETLSGYEQDVLALYLEGLSYQEMALALDKSIKSIDNALQRVKMKLEKELIKPD